LANVKALSHKSSINKPQAEGNVNLRLYSRRCSSNKPFSSRTREESSTT